jgi:uncharacterized protein YndB with AHSA1/START domain
VVETVEPPHRFVFRWSYPEGENPHDGNSLRVEFTLQPEGANTRLRVIESGFARKELPAQERSGYVEVHSKGWDAHMENLRAYVSGQR